MCVCRLGGVVVSVLATGPSGCGFEPGKGDGFLKAIKIRSTPSSRMGSKAGKSHVVSSSGDVKCVTGSRFLDVTLTGSNSPLKRGSYSLAI
jgi:hypothetical protein